MSNSLWHQGLNPIKLLCPWDFLGKDTGVGYPFLLHGIFLTQESNPCLKSPALAGKFFTTAPPGKPQAWGILLLSLVAQTGVKNLPAMWVWCLGREDPLEKGMATHFSILVWEIPWTEEPGRLQSMGSQRVRHAWATNPSIPIFLDLQGPRNDVKPKWLRCLSCW